jgi:hypothetical protein
MTDCYTQRLLLHSLISCKWLWVPLVLVFSGCNSGTIHSLSGSKDLLLSTTYFTRVNLWAENNRHLTENLVSGDLIPLGSPVRLESMEGRSIRIRLLDQNNLSVEILNNEDRSRHDPFPVFLRLFGTERPSLRDIPASTRESIRLGEIVAGMTRHEVLLSRGYPPRGQHRRLESRIWQYWEQGFDKTMVVFDDNGRVAYIL